MSPIDPLSVSQNSKCMTKIDQLCIGLKHGEPILRLGREAYIVGIEKCEGGSYSSSAYVDQLTQSTLHN